MSSHRPGFFSLWAHKLTPKEQHPTGQGMGKSKSMDFASNPEARCHEYKARRNECYISPDYSAADHFMGWKYKRAAQVDADLAAHVATELKNEAAIAKESRKAREEQKQRRQGPPKKGGDGGADK